MTATILPHPWLSGTVFLVWILLANEVSAGVVLLAVVVALPLGLMIGRIPIPKLTSVYWPDRARIGQPLVILDYIRVVLFDIVVSNVQVAKLVLFRRGDSLRSAYITIPLDLEAPEAVTVLAGTITMTPGTVTADYDYDSHTLKVHCLELDDEAATIAAIKNRYEKRLQRIFR